MVLSVSSVSGQLGETVRHANKEFSCYLRLFML